MAEFSPVSLSVIGCFASAEAIETVSGGDQIHRLAPDEAIAIDESESALAERLRRVDPDAVVLDTSDGWAAFALAGSDARQAFARLSELELPAVGFVQGDVARVHAKVLAAAQSVTVLVPAMWGEYLQERFEEVIAAP